MIPLHDNIKSKRFPFMNWLFILANLYVFYMEISLRSPLHLEHFVAQWAVIPVQLWKDFPHRGITLLTAAFLHGGWTHLIGNMLFLFVFGPSVENRMGHFRYPLFYLLVGALANGTQAYILPHSAIPLVGASGAIAGVLGAYFFYYPYAKILTLIPIFIFFRIVEVPAFLFLGFWFILQTIHGSAALSIHVQTQAAGGIAWWAHASGFIAGLILSPALAKDKGKLRYND